MNFIWYLLYVPVCDFFQWTKSAWRSVGRHFFVCFQGGGSNTSAYYWGNGWGKWGQFMIYYLVVVRNWTANWSSTILMFVPMIVFRGPRERNRWGFPGTGRWAGLRLEGPDVKVMAGSRVNGLIYLSARWLTIGWAMKVNGLRVSHHSGSQAGCVCIAAVGFQDQDWKGVRLLERSGKDTASLPFLSIGQNSTQPVQTQNVEKQMI